MKLIIDIPEKIEEYIKDYIPIGAGDHVFCYPDEIVRTIQNGTPIPDNATNKDTFFNVFGLEGWKQLIKYRNSAEEMNKWLNAPYQKGGKDV